MKAITQTQYGSPAVLSVQEIKQPIPKENEVLIRVHFSTVNRTDCGILSGKPWLIRLFTGLRNPSSLVPGTDFTGQIEAIGDQVSDFQVGDRVWGLNDNGLASQAEYMTIRANQAVVRIPDGVSYEAAAACAEGGHYAYNFLNKIQLPSDGKYLVNGATGAIGSATLQLLKSRGLYVTAVGNTKNMALLQQLGADKCYNYETEDFTQAETETYQAVFDAVGKSSFGQCKRLLVPGGVYLSSELGPHSENLYLPLLTKLKGGKRVIFPVPSDCKRSIFHLNSLLEKGQYQAVIDRTYSPEQIQEAYEYVASGQKTGSVLLRF